MDSIQIQKDLDCVHSLRLVEIIEDMKAFYLVNEYYSSQTLAQ